MPAKGFHTQHDPARETFDQVDDVRPGRRRPIDHLAQLRSNRCRLAWLREQVRLGQVELAGQHRAQPGHRVGPPEQLRRAQNRQHQVHPRLAHRRIAEDVQAVADLDILDLTQVAVKVHDEVVEALVVGHLVRVQVVMELGGQHKLPDLGADRRDLGRIESGKGGVLIQQLLKLGHVAIGVGSRHRRNQMIHHHGMGAPFGLGPLAGIVDDEGVHQRQIAEHRVRSAFC